MGLKVEHAYCPFDGSHFTHVSEQLPSVEPQAVEQMLFGQGKDSLLIELLFMESSQPRLFDSVDQIGQVFVEFDHKGGKLYTPQLSTVS